MTDPRRQGSTAAGAARLSPAGPPAGPVRQHPRPRAHDAGVWLLTLCLLAGRVAAALADLPPVAAPRLSAGHAGGRLYAQAPAPESPVAADRSATTNGALPARRPVATDRPYVVQSGPTERSILMPAMVVLTLLACGLTVGALHLLRTARRRSLDLEQQAAELRVVLDLVPHMVFVRDGDGRFLWANKAVSTATGRTSEQLAASTPGDAAQSPSDMLAGDAGVIQGGSAVTIAEATVTKSDGTATIVRAVKTPYISPMAHKPVVLTVAHDITDLKRSQEALHEEGESLLWLLNSVSQGVVVATLDAGVEWMNSAAQRLTGWSLADVRGRPVAAVLPLLGDDPQKPPENPVTVTLGRRGTAGHQCHGRLKVRDGSERRVVCYATPIHSPIGALAGVALVLQDTTDEEHRTEQRLQSEKMAIVGQLAGGIAHDFNNILGSLLGNAELLRPRVAADAETIAHVDEIIKHIQRAVTVNRQLLEFARKGPTTSAVVDLHQTVQEVVTAVQQTTGWSIRIKTDLQAHPSTTQGDPEHLRDALLQLVLNARDAMPNGGELAVSSQVVYLDEKQAHEDLYDASEVKAGSYVKLTVSDTGIGMDKATLRRIFEPFFTTKGTGLGRGMGLAAVYGVVRNHDGTIAVRSVPGKGSAFSLFLRVVVAPAEKPPAAAATMSVLPKKKATGEAKQTHILFVDDDEHLLAVAKQMLEKMGYSVTTKPDGASAVDFYRTNWNAIDLVVLDVVMPRMRAGDVFQRLREANPDTRVLLCTGYATNDEVQAILNEGAAGLLQKPFSVAQLSRAIASALAKSK